MKSIYLSSLLAAALFCSAVNCSAQEKPAMTSQSVTSLSAYDVNREVTLVGTVIAYSASSASAPAGPRVSLKTPSGLIDVHLGGARLLAANQFTIHPGDTLRIVGESITYAGGSQFVARIVQNGPKALLLRSIRGIPIVSPTPRGATTSATQGCVL